MASESSDAGGPTIPSQGREAEVEAKIKALADAQKEASRDKNISDEEEAAIEKKSAAIRGFLDEAKDDADGRSEQRLFA